MRVHCWKSKLSMNLTSAAAVLILICDQSAIKTAAPAKEGLRQTLTPALSHPPSAVMLRRTGPMGEGGAERRVREIDYTH
jgi:hypothetical protein